MLFLRFGAPFGVIFAPWRKCCSRQWFLWCFELHFPIFCAFGAHFRFFRSKMHFWRQKSFLGLKIGFGAQKAPFWPLGSQPASQPPSRPAGRPASQPASQPAGQPAKAPSPAPIPLHPPPPPLPFPSPPAPPTSLLSPEVGYLVS